MARTPTMTAIEKWVNKSEIDYMTYFIKTWIPFNAWYNRNYLNGSDRAKIQEIKKDSGNAFYKAISDLLEGRISAQEGEEFRGYIGALHSQLEASQIIYHYRPQHEDVLSFERCLKSINDRNITNESYDGITYYLERVDSPTFGEVSEVKITIKNRSNKTTFNYTHNVFDVSHVQAEMESKSISYNQSAQVISYLENLHPIIIKSALQETYMSGNENHCYECGNYSFVRNPSNTTNPSYQTTAALIEVLYQLRNLLFHGQIEPTPDIQPIYQNAYLIMRMLIPKLI